MLCTGIVCIERERERDASTSTRKYACDSMRYTEYVPVAAHIQNNYAC